VVEKRTLAFVTLGVLVWALMASAFVGYYYLQSRASSQQLDDNQYSLLKSALNYDKAISKYNALSGEYSALHGSCSFFSDSNYVELLKPFEHLAVALSRNYTSLLKTQEDLNEAYSELMDHYELLRQRGTVPKKEFEDLLNEYYNLFHKLVLKELAQLIGETVQQSVNIVIDYGNGTAVWRNDTAMSAGSTLFELTIKAALLNYTYYPAMEPGHILVNSINDKTTFTDPSYSFGYSWIWYHWNDAQKKWAVGPVGCDAWLLRDGCSYKWSYEYWHL